MAPEDRSEEHRDAQSSGSGGADRHSASDLEDLSTPRPSADGGPGQGTARTQPPGPTGGGRPTSPGEAETSPGEAGTRPASPQPFFGGGRVASDAEKTGQVKSAGDSDEITLEQRVALGMGLGLGLVGAALPALVLLWSVFALLALGVAAEALEHTGGLEATTFGGGYWLAAVLNGFTVLLSLGRLALRRPNPWRPLVWLILAYWALLCTLVPLDWTALWDVPDVLTAFAVLGAAELITYVLPLALLVLMLRGVRAAWLIGSVFPQSARRITSVCTCLGLAGLTVTGALVAGGAEGYFDTLAPTADEMQPLAANFVEDARRSMVELSEEIGPPLSLSAGESRDSKRFGACAEELADARAKSRSEVDKATITLIRRGLSKHDAEDVVMGTLVKVCLKHAEGDVKEVVPYFWRAVSNNGQHVRRDWDLVVDEERFATEDDDPRAALALQQELAAVRAALEGLDSSDRRILELRYVDGLDYREIAGRLGKSEAAARQQMKRARARLRRAFERELAGR